jgi:hypothetical protein
MFPVFEICRPSIETEGNKTLLINPSIETEGNKTLLINHLASLQN